VWDGVPSNYLHGPTMAAVKAFGNRELNVTLLNVRQRPILEFQRGERFTFPRDAKNPFVIDSRIDMKNLVSFAAETPELARNPVQSKGQVFYLVNREVRWRKIYWKFEFLLLHNDASLSGDQRF
jgi:hypothetical protein